MSCSLTLTHRRCGWILLAETEFGYRWETVENDFLPGQNCYIQRGTEGITYLLVSEFLAGEVMVEQWTMVPLKGLSLLGVLRKILGQLQANLLYDTV